MAHCENPGSYVNFTSAGFRKEPFPGSDKGTTGSPDKSDPTRRTLVY